MNQNPRILLTDTGANIIAKLSEGNPGALAVCIGLLKDGAVIDPQAMMGGLHNLLSLDDLEIYGSEIYIFGKYVCGGRTDNVALILRSRQLGLVSSAQIAEAIRGRDAEAFDFGAIAEGVKDEISEFECYECDKTFSYERNHEVTYSTSRDCAQNDDEHDWQFRYHSEKHNSDTYLCAKCDTLDFRESKQEWLDLTPTGDREVREDER